MALAQGATACPVGEACLPPPGVSAAAAAGAATMLALTFGAAGRFVSQRRDAAIRGGRGASADGIPDGRTARIRAAILEAWRAG